LLSETFATPEKDVKYNVICGDVLHLEELLTTPNAFNLVLMDVPYGLQMGPWDVEPFSDKEFSEVIYNFINLLLLTFLLTGVNSLKKTEHCPILDSCLLVF
jgi:hypothetical protein